MNDLSDAEIIRAVLAGRTEDYAELVRRHRDAQYRFALRMLGDVDDADDGVQSAFVRASVRSGTAATTTGSERGCGRSW